MSAEDIRAIGEALGWPVAVVILVSVVMLKNGWFRLIIRGEREDVIHSVSEDVKDLAELCRGIDERLHEIEKDVAVLNDRAKRGD